MPVTITAGITFSGGGLTMEFAPPSQATAGWFAAGQNTNGDSISPVDRMTYATDTAIASSRGPLNTAVRGLAAAGTLTDGWFGGGYTPGLKSLIQRITYATDTATASLRGTLSQARYRMSATSDTTTYGWYGGGINGAASLVDRITYATDTATASVRGPLAATTYYNTATGTTSYGWYAGGGASPVRSTIDRIDYANDTATASGRGPLTAATYRFSGSVTDGTTYGWFAGGKGPASPYPVATVSRVTFANDTVTTTNRGSLASSRYANSGTSNDSTYGWFAGGGTFNAGFTYLSNITRITYANDTVASTDRGNLNRVNALLAGASGLQ